MMEVRIMYPNIIFYSLIIALVLALIWRKKKKFKKGIIVANTKYLKNTKTYKLMNIKYVLYNALIYLLCFILVFLSAVLTSRLYNEEKKEEIKEYYNRDIMLVLDCSGSMSSIINKIVDHYINVVEKLKGDRFGVVLFGGAPSTVLPLTDDYNYALSVLKEIKNHQTKSGGSLAQPGAISLNFDLWKWSGMSSYSCCGSSDGDGLAASLLNFEKNNDRTKIVVLAADHEVVNYIVSLNEAVNIAKDYNVKILYIDGDSTTKTSEKMNAANLTGGKYYDAKKLSVNEIIKDIDSYEKTLQIEKNIDRLRYDLPEKIFQYILLLTLILFVLNLRVRT